jgi:hypothetical protein
MIDVKKLIEDHLKSTKLDILVFGPAVDPPSKDPHVASLQVKRKDIKQTLIDEGHSAAFGEDVVNSTLPAPISDPLLQEIVAMRAADLIIVLVGAPGAIFEAATIAREKELCGKAQFYCFEDHKDGLVVRHLQYMSAHGATCRLVSLAEVQACKLKAVVLEKVRAVQVGKAFLF